jgi:hypothetical protein
MTFIIWGTTSTPECQEDACSEVQFTFQKMLHTNLAVSAEYKGMIYITSVTKCNGLQAPKTNHNFYKHKHLKIGHKIHPPPLI